MEAGAADDPGKRGKVMMAEIERAKHMRVKGGHWEGVVVPTWLDESAHSGKKEH